MTLYDLKPRFQALLRPLVGRLAGAGVTANMVTLTAMVLSVAVGLLLLTTDGAHGWFLALPLWLALRMVLNAADGMLAREFGQKSALGAYLNEVGDVVSDAALYLPFAFVAPFSGPWVTAVVILSVLTELAGVLGQTVGASRRYDGPLGKSDRALVFGALGLLVGLGWPLPLWAGWLMPVLAILLVWTTINRIHRGLAEAAANAT